MKNLINFQKKLFGIKLPSISFDIDGVLKKGNNPIPRAKEAIIKIKERGIPLSLVTNGGGELEGIRGNKISHILKLEDQFKFKAHEVFLCHTPMKDLLSKFKDKLILISGIHNSNEVIENYGFTKYMTVHEYYTIFQEIAPLFSFLHTKEERKSIIKNVEKRLESSLSHNNIPPVHALFMLTDVVNWEINAQVRVSFIEGFF